MSKAKVLTDERIIPAADNRELIRALNGENETMVQKRLRYEALANARGAKRFEFTPMQNGVDFECRADFGNGMEPFYPDKNVTDYFLGSEKEKQT